MNHYLDLPKAHYQVQKNRKLTQQKGNSKIRIERVLLMNSAMVKNL